MPLESQLFSYRELINEIISHFDKKTSGSLFLFAKDNMLIRIILDQGRIIAMACGNNRGMDVIPKIQSITSCRLRVSMNKTLKEGDALPSTQDIINQLQSKSELNPSNANGPIKNITSDQIERALNIIESELIEFLGPMGSIVWEEHMEEMGKLVSADGFESLINQLAEEIGNTEKINTFKKNIKSKISNI